MNTADETVLGRRRLLSLIAASGVAAGLAGCSGGGGDDAGTAAGTTPTATDGMPPVDGSAGAGTSLAGSCGAAFGDTDQQYQAVSSQWIVTFAYPMGGEVFYAGSAGDEIAASIGYVPDGNGGYAQELTVTQEDGATMTAEELAEQDGWKSGDPVTYEGAEHAVAVQSSDDSVTMSFVVEGDEETHGLLVTAAPGTAEPCPEAYTGVCRRVLESITPRQ